MHCSINYAIISTYFRCIILLVGLYKLLHLAKLDIIMLYIKSQKYHHYCGRKYALHPSPEFEISAADKNKDIHLPYFNKIN